MSPGCSRHAELLTGSDNRRCECGLGFRKSAPGKIEFDCQAPNSVLVDPVPNLEWHRQMLKVPCIAALETFFFSVPVLLVRKAWRAGMIWRRASGWGIWLYHHYQGMSAISGPHLSTCFLRRAIFDVGEVAVKNLRTTAELFCLP